MMTKQEVFDTVVRHLAHQGERSTLDGELCAYRGPNGTKCAVGVLIKDEHYQEYFNSWSASSDAVVGALRKSGVPASTMEERAFLRDLQWIHDNPDHWDDESLMLQEFIALAVRERLDVSVVDECFR